MSEEILLHSEGGNYDYSKDFDFLENTDGFKAFRLSHTHSGISCVHGVEIICEGKKVKVILSELPENRTENRAGLSVTNIYEDIANIVYDEFLKDIDPKNITWIEYYPYLKRHDHYDSYENSNSGELYKEVRLDYQSPGRFNGKLDFQILSCSEIKGIKSIFHKENPHPKSPDFLKNI